MRPNIYPGLVMEQGNRKSAVGAEIISAAQRNVEGGKTKAEKIMKIGALNLYIFR